MDRRKIHRGSPGRLDLKRLHQDHAIAPTRTPFQQTLMHYYPSSLLLAVHVILLVLYIFIDGASLSQYILNGLGLAVLSIVVWVINRRTAAKWAVWVLAVPALVLILLSALQGSPGYLPWAFLLTGLLYLYGAGSMVAYMMEDERVTLDELFAAGSTFMMIAWAFGFFYLVCQVLVPGSFIGVAGEGQEFTLLEMLSLSFTNLTATGLSDILPAANAARVLIMLEQFMGVGFIAMVVSRLVGLTMQHKVKP